MITAKDARKKSEVVRASKEQEFKKKFNFEERFNSTVEKVESLIKEEAEKGARSLRYRIEHKGIGVVLAEELCHHLDDFGYNSEIRMSSKGVQNVIITW